MSLRAPVGTVIAYGGDIRNSDLKLQGWVPCDGAPYRCDDATMAELYALIKTSFGGDSTTFNVPSLGGMFIRGTDHGRGKDPGASTRTAIRLGGATADAVGSMQTFATARPVTAPFTTSTNGSHDHSTGTVPNDSHETAAAFPSAPEAMEWNNDSATSSSTGAHSHVIAAGGDAESRPANLYLFYLIKFRSDAAPPRGDEATSFPVGTILPFAADTADQVIADKLAADGWYRCAGAAHPATDSDPLFKLIQYTFGGGNGQYLLPDLRGMFVRGATSALRVGTVQEFRTALPVRAPFRTNSTGDHQHTVKHAAIGTYTSDWAWPGHQEAAASDRRSTDSAGAHAHTVVGGGDAETRPINLYFDYIIKYRE